MDLYNQYLIPTNLQPCNTTSGLEQLPTQLNAQWNCLSPFQPYQPLYQYHPYSHLRLACRCLEWCRAWSGVGAESEKRKVGWATGPEVGEKVNIQPMLEDGGEGFLWLRYYSILFPCKNRFPLEYTRCHIQYYSPPIYESKFGATTTDFTPQKHTITKRVLIPVWSLHG